MEVQDIEAVHVSSDRDAVVRVVHIATRLPVGGMESVVASLAQGLPRHGYECSIWCLEEADRLGRDLRAGGIELVEFGRRQRRNVGLFVRLARLAVEKGIDVFHCHDEVSWFYGAVAARLARVPLSVVTMHGRRFNISNRHVVEQRLLARCTDCIISVSEYLRQQLLSELHLRSERVVTVHNGVVLPPATRQEDAVARARRALDVSADALVVGCVGELSAVKNFAMAIEAVAEARQRNSRLQLVLIGDGACRDSLEQRARDCGIEDSVRFAGLRRDVPDLWPAIDVYVCSSDYEGISLSVLEAMGSGLAVIATNVGGNPEIVQHDRTGLLVPARDPQALAVAISRLAEDAALRQRLGRHAQDLARSTFDVATMVDRYDLLYRGFLDAARERSRARSPRFKYGSEGRSFKHPGGAR